MPAASTLRASVTGSMLGWGTCRRRVAPDLHGRSYLIEADVHMPVCAVRFPSARHEHRRGACDREITAAGTARRAPARRARASSDATGAADHGHRPGTPGGAIAPACWSPPIRATIGIVFVAALATRPEMPPPMATITSTGRRTSSDRHGRQPIILSFGRPIFDQYVLAFMISVFSQTIAEFIQRNRERLGRVQVADHRHCLLLGAESARRDHHAAQSARGVWGKHSFARRSVWSTA
jgi:hypothetical protein